MDNATSNTAYRMTVEDLKMLRKKMDKALASIELFNGRSDQARTAYRVLKRF